MSVGVSMIEYKIFTAGIIKNIKKNYRNWCSNNFTVFSECAANNHGQLTVTDCATKLNELQRGELNCN